METDIKEVRKLFSKIEVLSIKSHGEMKDLNEATLKKIDNGMLVEDALIIWAAKIQIMKEETEQQARELL